MDIVLIGFLVAIIALIFFVISIYNRLVQLKNRFKNAFAQIDVQLRRRYDLIPNLVEVAKGYMKHEKETLQAVIEARNMASNAQEMLSKDPANAGAMKKLSQAEGQLGGLLSRLFALSESYPDLKANQNMMQLSEELTSTENKISFARQSYNDSVMQYNIACEQFPNNLFASMFGFQKAELFEIKDQAVKETPQVSFS